MTIRPDCELVEAVVAGNRDAFAELVARYRRSALGVAAQIVHDKHDAEDIAQDAFVLAYERLNSLRNGDAFGPWLLQIARRQAFQRVRKERRIRKVREVPCDSLVETTQRNGQLDDASRELLRLIEKLPEHEQVVLMFKYFDGHAVADIARMTGQTVGTVTKKLSRARKRLQTLLKRNDA